jgi:hypothetical protein
VRIGLGALPVAVLAMAVIGPASQLASLVGAGDWGSDWRWLEDGLRRLAAGAPLVRPEYAAAPFTQFPNGPAYTWSLHPPSTATLVAPLLLLPDWLREPAWTWLMAAALGIAVWLAWPRRLWWGTQLLVVAVVLGPPLVGVSVGLVNQLHFANPNALVVLGVVLTWLGRRHGSVGLVAGGLVLAAVKVVPAIGLVVWLLAGRAARPDPGRASPPAVAIPAILSAGAILVALTLPVLVIDPGALADTIAAQAHLIPWSNEANLAPAVRLAPLLGTDAATWLARLAAGALLGLVLARRLDGPGGFVLAAAAPLLLTPQLWAHWLLIPAAAVLVTAEDWEPIRSVDRRLRLAWLGTSPTPAPPRRRATGDRADG